MPRIWACPFWISEGKNCIACENAKLRFKNHPEFDRFAGRYCSSVTGWEDCTIAQHSTAEFERGKNL